MTSKERIRAAWEGKHTDHVPLTTWCFGVRVPESLQWEKNGRRRKYWYSQRMEHLHTLPFPWETEDEFKRVSAWQSIGVDDMVDVSVPWGIAPEVSWQDSRTEPEGNERYPIMTREYDTPAGPIRHSVRETLEEMQVGWVVQPDHVPLIEDFNIPRAVEHAVGKPADVGPLGYLYTPPGPEQRSWFERRMNTVQPFAEEAGVPVQAWTGFGMDAVVWLTGTEKAIMMSLDEPEAFHKLIDIITETDEARTELAASHPGVDIVTERGWYSSTDFWSPSLFDEFLFNHIKTLAAAAHKHGKKFGYVMTTGVETLGPRLADADVDVLYFVDPIDPVLQGKLNLPKIRDLLSDRMCIVGGVSSLTLGKRREELEQQIRTSMEVFKPTDRFILHPVDALFPNTPWEGIENLIEIWKEYR